MSCDFGVGGVFNLAQYSILLMMIAQVVDMEPYEFIWSIGDCHIYLSQLKAVEEQLTRTPQPLPTVRLNPAVKDLFKFTTADIEVVDYNPLSKIDYPVLK